MAGLLLLVLVLVMVFGGLGYAVSPLFFLAILAVLVIAATGVFYSYRRL